MSELIQYYKEEEIRNNDLKCVDLGCGKKKLPGYIGIDCRDFNGVDYVLNIEKDKLPFEDDSIDLINTEQVFEHLTCEGLFHCIDECWRVLKPKGFIRITVPKFPDDLAVLHPDHKRFFIPDTFGFFQAPANGYDPHGYLHGHFWHVNVLSKKEERIITVVMYPNKPDGRYKYQEIKNG